MTEPRAHAASVRPSRATTALMFVVATAVGVFDVASYAYLARASTDFIVARRERHLPVYRLGQPMRWQDQVPGQLFGWARPEAAGTWSVGAASAIEVRLVAPPDGDVILAAWAGASLHPLRLPVREVTVAVKGVELARWRFDSPNVVRQTARIPGSLIGDDGRVRIDFRQSEDRSPRALGIGDDTRRIGMLVVEWSLAAAPR